MVARIGARSAHKASTASTAKPKKQSAIKNKPASGRWGKTHDKFDHGRKKPSGIR